MTLDEVMDEMAGKPISEVTQRLADLIEEAGKDVPMEVHLRAMASAMLMGYQNLARDLAVLMQSVGLNVDPDEYAAHQVAAVLLLAQGNVYVRVMGEQ